MLQRGQGSQRFLSPFSFITVYTCGKWRVFGKAIEGTERNLSLASLQFVKLVVKKKRRGY